MSKRKKTLMKATSLRLASSGCSSTYESKEEGDAIRHPRITTHTLNPRPLDDANAPGSPGA